GRYHNLALASDGSLWGWGHNSFGTVGDGTTVLQRTTPVRVHGAGNIGFLSDIKQISCGSHTSYALKNDGTVWAWGSNVTGRIGDNTITNRSTPTPVHGPANVGFLTGVTAIAGAGTHALALKDDGTVWTWGTNLKGQLGDGTATSRWTPVQVVGVGGIGFLNDVVTLAGGGMHSWVMKSDGAVFAWGSNSGGQIGDNTSGLGADRATPVQVHGQNNIGVLGNIIGVTSAVVGDQSFAIADDGTLWGWGRDTSGQMGNGLPLLNELTPVPIAIP
ncbi:MAG: hypothetical protein HYV03_02415, partial [Deltaproteobacteria bacterium]|nr:hypothetical protein [Deltaproteobacteria bacterium]